jgi:NADPH2:quinone reductase
LELFPQFRHDHPGRYFDSPRKAQLMPNEIDAVVVDPTSSQGLVIRKVPAPQPYPDQALVRVKTISLNPGELRRSKAAPAGSRIGWDFAGVVEQPAANGSGPQAGARVVGMMGTGSWAQMVAATTNAIAVLPDSVTFAQAATIPVAGLTALHALYKGRFILNKPVLITAATGGTGDFACQLASLAGAKVVATVRSPDRESFVRSLGVEHVVIGDDPYPAAGFGPYQLIIDSVGGPNFGKILAMLASGGTCVIFGTSAGAEPVINAQKFYSTNRTTLYGMIMFEELKNEPASAGLANLASLVAAGKVTPHIALEDSWRNLTAVAQKLTAREFLGKAVLNVD